MSAAPAAPGPAAAPARLVGARVRKHDGDAYLTGRATYTGDVTLPGTTHAALVRSPHAHALITGIDTSAARAMPGVLEVLTGAQVAERCDEVPHALDAGHLGGHHAVVMPLAVDKVVYATEPVAAVVATTQADAAAAAAAVRVDYELLPVVLSADEALAPGAPLLHPAWGDNVLIAGDLGVDDFEEASAGAAHLLSGTVHGHRGTAAPMETRSYLADWDAAAGQLTLYATTQNPHPLRTTLAQCLRLPEHRIRVVASKVGGSFGLKMYGSREDFIVAVLAMAVGRPVRWVEERSAALLPAARDHLLHYRAAADADGRLVALDVLARTDMGAPTSNHGWGMAFVGAQAVGAGYALEHCHVRYEAVVTNKAPVGGTKPFGKDAATLLGERVLDRIAAVTGLDPAEVRRRNFLAPDAFPHVHTSGLELDSGQYAAALELTLDRLDHSRVREEQERARAQGRLVGVGLGFELMPESADIPGALVAGYDTSTVRMAPTGAVTVLTGVTTPGTGSDTGIGQLVADVLGVGMDALSIVSGDTDRAPYGYGNISSRSIITGGSAAVLAAGDVAEKLRTAARALLGAPAGAAVVLAGGTASLAEDPARAVPIPVAAHAVHALSYALQLDLEPHLESTRTFRPANIRQVPDALGRLQTYTTFPYALHASLLEVDPETGVTTLLRHVVTHDCGTVVNPLFVDGQVVGGTVMGIGAALGEELRHEADGVPASTGFKTYLLPRASDLPTIELEHLCTPSPVIPSGAKGVGEVGFSGGMTAVVAAVNDALSPLGVSVEGTPVTPPVVLAAIRGARRAQEEAS